MFINCHSYFSLRYGIHSEETILKIAQAGGATTAVLTDINNTSGCLNFIRLAPKYNIKPLIGVDFRNGALPLYTAIAKNNEGFYQINQFLTKYKNQNLPYPEQSPDLKDVLFIYPYEQILLVDKQNFRSDEYIGISVRDLRKLRFSKWTKWSKKFVVFNAFTFTNKQDFNVHRLLRAIDNNELLSKLPKTEEASPEDLFFSLDTIQEAYQNVPEIIYQTEKLLDSCHIFFDFSPGRKHQNKKMYSGSVKEDIRMIKNLSKLALSYRYDEITPKIQNRLNKELDVIIKMDYVPFFLINWDIISYAKSKGYFHVGRGSGANSIVAYLLGITDVDPIELDLYFERFMNLYRSTPPDFDIDFSWRDREDVTQYIFDRFGKEGQASLLGTYNTFKHSASVRELGKVFGLPKHEIDKLSDGRYTFKTLDKLNQLVLVYAKRLQGMPNYISVHSAGIIISEKPIHYFTATDMPPKGFPTTQFDMVLSEDVGLYKYDILGQRGLGKIKDSLAIIKHNQPDKELLDIHQIKPILHDPKNQSPNKPG